MDKRLTTFADHFAAHHASYVLIGGMACALNDANFRTTRDLDIVLIADQLSAEFSNTLWDFIKAGGYEHRQRSKENSPDKAQFYRFHSPKDESFPYMLELFCRKPDGLNLPENATLTPIPVEDPVSSLSAILLDDETYAYIVSGKTMKDHISALTPLYIIPLKALAYMNLRQDKERGMSVDSKVIKKHKKDVFYLLSLLPDDATLSLPSNLQQALQSFIAISRDEPIPREHLKIIRLTQNQVFDTLADIYL